jgi:hypothetical protein
MCHDNAICDVEIALNTGRPKVIGAITVGAASRICSVGTACGLTIVVAASRNFKVPGFVNSGVSHYMSIGNVVIDRFDGHEYTARRITPVGTASRICSVGAASRITSVRTARRISQIH